MTSTPPKEEAPQRDASAVAQSNADARAKVLGWARRTVDLIPTPWLVTGAGAVLLATTAAFGGLETAPVKPLPELTVGDTYTGSDLEITIVGVELWDERGNAAVFPDEEEGERVLAITLEVTSTYDKPRGATALATPSPSVDGVHVDGMEGKPAISRADDGDFSTTLQPDVPTRLLLSWLVGPDDFHDGDSITLTLPDSTRTVGNNVLKGQTYWDDVRVGATATATVEEVTAP